MTKQTRPKFRILSLVLAVAMVCTMGAVPAFAAAPGYTLNGTVLTVTSNAGCQPNKWLDNQTITEVIIEDGVTIIGEKVFSGCSNLEKVTMADSVTKIGSAAFGDTPKLTTVNLSKNVSTLGWRAFIRSGLEKFTIPERITAIPEEIFYNCTKLKTVIIPEGVQNIERNAFYGCSVLTSVAIPASMTDIGVQAFIESGLTSFTLPKTVTNIGNSAFDACADMTSFTVESDDPTSCTVGTFVFNNMNSDFQIYVPVGKVAAYKAADGWKNYERYIAADFVAVTDITGLPTAAQAGEPLTLAGTVAPDDATNKTITWSVKDAGTTGAAISGDEFTATAAGTAMVTATVTKGKSATEDFTKDFTIAVSDEPTPPSGFVAVTGITGVPTKAAVGSTTLSATVNPANATHKTITWDVLDSGATGATVSGNTLTTTAEGTVQVQATVADGTAEGTDYTQSFTITVSNTPAPPTKKSSGSSKSSWVPTITANVIDVPEGKLGLGTYNNYDKLLVQGLETLVAQSKGKTVSFDTVENGKVLYRIKLDPAKLAGVLKNDLSLSAHIGQNDAAVLEVTNRFAKYYENSIVAITYDQVKPLDVSAEFAARLDLSKLNTKTLYFYSYDNTTNTYARITAPSYFVDVNGYSHITAPLGGSIIITDKLLTSK